MTYKIFKVIRSTPTSLGHAQRIKILVNLNRVNSTRLLLENEDTSKSQ